MFPAVPDGCLSRGKAPAYTNGSYRSNSPRMHRHDSTGSEALTRLNQKLRDPQQRPLYGGSHVPDRRALTKPQR